ncbi:Diphosphoinositol polyphosphate phosphohydrolase 1 [Fukomys damarensis]|uniref:Diphosphoinositol polyphosphate phosphohydrolase 1 n=1 Tax=Fukomys damarensis TaxID=885580 RepID=A0A091CWT0_FUKDA|nr:Diphosphoinositol polyphosphate phosphohydrolase 1 [Fukomys damarensis]
MTTGHPRTAVLSLDAALRAAPAPPPLPSRLSFCVAPTLSAVHIGWGVCVLHERINEAVNSKSHFLRSFFGPSWWPPSGELWTGRSLPEPAVPSLAVAPQGLSPLKLYLDSHFLFKRLLGRLNNITRSAGVKGTLGRLVGVFENQERKHRTYVYVLIVTEVLEDWEDSVNIAGSWCHWCRGLGARWRCRACVNEPSAAMLAPVLGLERDRGSDVALATRVLSFHAALSAPHGIISEVSGRKREWFKIEEAVKVLQCHKPVQASYFETLRQGYSANNGTPLVAATYSVSPQSSMPGIR